MYSTSTGVKLRLLYSSSEGSWRGELNTRPPLEPSIWFVHILRTELQQGQETRVANKGCWNPKRELMVSFYSELKCCQVAPVTVSPFK